MAITYTDNGGGAPNGSDLEFTYTFPVIQTEDVKVALNGVTQATTKYAVDTASNPTKITFNNTSVDSSVQESTGAPKSGVLVRVFRQTTVGKSTGDDDPKAVYAAGSSIRAVDLNANTEQALYAIHELQEQPIENPELQDGSVTSSKILDGTIVNADVNASAAIAGTKIAPDFGSQNIATTGTINGVTTTELAILDGATVSTAELNLLDGVTSTTAELNILDGVTATATELNIIDGVTATTAEINKLDGVTATTAEVNILDGVTASTTEINKLDGVTASTAELNVLDGVTATTAELNKLDGFTGTTANLNSISGLTSNVTELNLLDGVTATTAELNLNDGQTATPTEVNILDGATVTTTELNKLDGYTGSTADLNEVVAGKNVVETISGTATDAQIPTAQAVNERVVELVTEVGGFHPIANETSFPSTNPDINDGAGTIVSIKALSSAFTTGSGVTTKVFTNGAGSGVNVTVNGLTQSTTYPAGRGMLLETTSTLHTYNFHRLTLDETGVAAAQAAIDDWDERYYGPLGSAPSTRPGGGSRVQGDLYFSTADNQMKVWNNAASQWDDVASSASSNIVTLTPAFNNSETEFTCSTVPVDAQSLLLSINGVIQKPNSGTSTPSEGYVKLANGKIKLATAPATGSSYFAIALGNTVSVGTPSPNTVGATELKTGEIANTHISSSAAIAGSKLADDSISLAKLEHGTSSNNGKFLRANNGADPSFETVNTDLVADTSPQLGGDLQSNGNDIDIADNDKLILGTGNDTHLYHNGVHTYISHRGTGNLILEAKEGEAALSAISDGAVELCHNGIKTFETQNDGISVIGPQGGGAFVTFQSDQGDDNADLFDVGCYDGGPFKIQNKKSGSWEDSLVITGDAGGVDLYYDNTLKFGTDSAGVYARGDLMLNYADNYKIKLGAGNDLQIYHDGSNSRINNTDTGIFYFDTAGELQLRSTSTKKFIRAIQDGAVELYHDNSKKLETTTSGITVTGSVNTSGLSKASGNIFINNNDTSNGVISFATNTNDRWKIDFSGHFVPANNNDVNIGSSSKRVANIYTNDLHLSNIGHSNDVDGTWGDWTIQEGESDLFLKNNRSGKKYKFNLTEVS